MTMTEKPADWNDAYVWPQPDTPPDEPAAEEFEVIGETTVDGHAPGERFRAVIDDQRKALLLGSHLALVAGETMSGLQEQARELGIKGRSKMDKAELQDAVEQALLAQQDPAELTNPAAGLAQDDQQ